MQVGYWLEPVLALAPFCKDPVHLSLSGVTHHPLDPSPDMLKVDKEIYPPNIYLQIISLHYSPLQASCLPVLKKFILDDEGLEISVKKRGAAPGGGGLVLLR